MYLVIIGWLYVTVMMAAAEAASPQGSLLGAAVTFVLYGLVPISIVAYILGTPARKRALRQREQHERERAARPAGREAPPADAASAATRPEPDAGGEPPAGAAEPLHGGAVRKEP
ncbi:hypothetical protein Acav_2736 [Paracidovorax avenae ATCC 19860]|uniref:Transmembrane protein n=1 Tax=Paracidovorax avenae (strain ATCC 19860 / DSM 7227 / CCUG 15838 / JCM 20985 / LMG 2117 / NCPPB 1011) TaxID=643561 RepID=F0Q361_PARA1|nr:MULTISPECIES: hypothetical protein [Comamonadaceae]ADX46645.1 hypothetical protein Acav_2736 [Paracidovorax avenae ATCC 19860]MDA8452722.1 hypothetical protein [Acidovorax sp. GBBC 3297]MDA8462129.1 hypothetical protein [Acidovorax sp. GBBC 3333]MDA8467164.1 hypothetical protein [Acidovorax sp. GBBC 3332]MDA8472199.1 hypothetical protein [Acidovorax sp. GBBC 3299]